MSYDNHPLVKNSVEAFLTKYPYHKNLSQQWVIDLTNLVFLQDQVLNRYILGSSDPKTTYKSYAKNYILQKYWDKPFYWILEKVELILKNDTIMINLDILNFKNKDYKKIEDTIPEQNLYYEDALYE